MIKHLFTLSLCALFFASCASSGKKEAEKKEHAGYAVESPLIVTDSMRTIPVRVEGDYFNHLEEYMQAVSYVKLAPEPMLAGIRDVHIRNERIYVLDQTSRLVCYDMQGNVVYQIYAIGNGPGEYAEINSFTVDTYKEEIVVYDNQQTSLLYYSVQNGKYLRSEKFVKPNPSEIAFFDHVFFYNNRDHRNYPDDSSLHYSLLVSADGLTMDKRYFPHDKAEEKYIFSPSSQTFNDNETALFYCRNFDNTVYRVGKDSIEALYSIDLPNPLPHAKIEDRADEMGLIRSGYAFGITHVYECGGLLYFRFTKDGYIMAALYDLAADRQVCCVKAMQDGPRPAIPLFNIVNGVYGGRFFGVLTPDFIDYKVSKRPGEYPLLFQQYDAHSDNPVIAFYEVIKH